MHQVLPLPSRRGPSSCRILPPPAQVDHKYLFHLISPSPPDSFAASCRIHKQTAIAARPSVELRNAGTSSIESQPHRCLPVHHQQLLLRLRLRLLPTVTAFGFCAPAVATAPARGPVASLDAVSLTALATTQRPSHAN